MVVERMEVHELARVFPELKQAALNSLMDSIRNHGFSESHPIVLLDGKIIDGRNRYIAARAVGVQPIYRDFDPVTEGDPCDFVVRENIHRRHLTTSQRAMVAARLATLKRGDNQHTEGGDKSPCSTGKAAEALSVSRDIVKQARTVRREAPELAEKVERGEMTVGAAATEAKKRKGKKPKSKTTKKKAPPRDNLPPLSSEAQRVWAILETLSRSDLMGIAARLMMTVKSPS